MELKKIPQNIIDDLKERGHSDKDIEQMSPERAFHEFCEWNGLVGWASTLRNTLDSLRAAQEH